MSALIAILVLVLLGLVVLVVAAPLRAARRGGRTHAAGLLPGEADAAPGPRARIEADELDAAREAKYREIRDAEMDFRTGKLSAEDYRTIDSQLRAEALVILDRLERDGARSPAASRAGGDAGEHDAGM